MRLRALDQIHVSSVRPDTLRPGDEFDINDAAGADLLKALPGRFAQVEDSAAGQDPAEKADVAPPNKAEPAPNNKAAAETHRRRRK